MAQDINPITCGAFTAQCVGYNQWEFTCSWLPEFREVKECTKNKAADLIMRLQAEYRNSKLEVVA